MNMNKKRKNCWRKDSKMINNKKISQYMNFILNILAIISLLNVLSIVIISTLEDSLLMSRNIFRIVFYIFSMFIMFFHSFNAFNVKYKFRKSILIPIFFISAPIIFNSFFAGLYELSNSIPVFLVCIVTSLILLLQFILLTVYNLTKALKEKNGVRILFLILTILSSLILLTFVLIYIIQDCMYMAFYFAIYFVSLIFIAINISETINKAKKPAYYQMPYANINANPKQEPEDNAKKIEKLVTYKKLLDDNAITQEEFDKIKKDLL